VRREEVGTEMSGEAVLDSKLMITCRPEGEGGGESRGQFRAAFLIQFMN
jgi:hypothetical protein